MKRIRSLVFALALPLAMIPAVALADFDGEDDDVTVIGDFDDVNPIPEPSSALVMGAALATVALVVRRRR